MLIFRRLVACWLCVYVECPLVHCPFAVSCMACIVLFCILRFQFDLIFEIKPSFAVCVFATCTIFCNSLTILMLSKKPSQTTRSYSTIALVNIAFITPSFLLHNLLTVCCDELSSLLDFYSRHQSIRFPSSNRTRLSRSTQSSFKLSFVLISFFCVLRL